MFAIVKSGAAGGGKRLRPSCRLIKIMPAFLIATAVVSPTFAADSASSNTANAAPIEEPARYRDYNEIFGETNARTLLMTARQHMRQHNYRRAIPLLAKAVKLDPDDPDVLMLYANALAEKLSHQEEKDPELFNLCVKTLLTVVRNEAGEEKGITYKGIGIGTGFYQDEERTMRAKKDLKMLTGYLPKPWETNDRYLRRVLKPTSTSVTGKVRMPGTDEKSAGK